MSTVLRIGPYQFHFNKPGKRRAATHSRHRDDIEAKFWLQPISVAANHGFGPAELPAGAAVWVRRAKNSVV
jgi:hypothetical protein